MLFTRCPECDTTFRVTDEALKKANGQVRCGRCASVFNAHAELQDSANVSDLQSPPLAAEAATQQPEPAPPAAGKAAEPDPTATGIGAASVAAVVAEAKLAAAEEEAAAETGTATGDGSEARAGAGLSATEIERVLTSNASPPLPPSCRPPSWARLIAPRSPSLRAAT